jgi:signal transduction histidine kinase
MSVRCGVVACPRVLLVAMVAMVALLCCTTDARAEQKDVLVLYATRPDARISAYADRELPQILERGLGERVNYYAEHLDLARFPEPSYRSGVGDFLHVKYSGRQLDLVIAMHEIVLDFLDTAGHLFPETPVVFFTDSSSTRRRPNSTGVVADINFAATVAFASAIQPSLRQLFVVAGTGHGDQLAERRARSQLRAFEPGLAITYLSGLPTSELRARLSALPAGSAVYYLMVNRDGGGERHHPLFYLQDNAPLANVPTYSWVDSGMGLGILGGSLKSQQKQTEAVAELALRVLRGEHPDSIPTTSPDLQLNQVDWRQLRRWGISESSLPAGTLVMFKDPTVWERYKAYIILGLVVVLAQTALIVGLLVQRAGRRQAEEQVRGSQAKLQTSYARIGTLGARLLEAQETERARIARELHDDISQQLALLATDLELLRATPPDTAGVTSRAWGRVQTLAASVHDLAYRLYPAKLRLIGLVPALQSLQREMERSVIVMNFVHDNIPRALPPDVTLCLFRVAQEALQNAVKYSAAREVSVSLQGTPDGLDLMIADDGVGFDVDSAWGKGLGLVSMSERLEALNGTLQVHSAPGVGTRIFVTLPLAAGEQVASAG